ncbi:MAG TPA: glycoside hydrolase family 3 C-terminal domain-containing protein, partial [Lachnospiraceae bacterium]|nr:glycoside hydrolase family 3 C-terminal domain-containing protein [Lachnospiraceae bacterium]
PATGNRRLMQDILRKEMGFAGVLISDWAAIEELVFHGVAADKKEAAQLAMNAGVDIDMCTNSYIKNIEPLIGEGRLTMEQLNEAVLRVLELKNRLGLFENPYRFADEKKAEEVILCREHRALAREAASSSMVLLKNDGQLLPLQEKGKRIALIGPYADCKHLYGAWSLLGRDEDTVSIREGLTELSPDDTITFAKGCYMLEKGEKLYGFRGLVKEERPLSEEQLMDEAVREAEQADLVVLALGECAYHSGEGGSRADIRLPKEQRKLLKKIAGVNKNIAVVLFHGRPLDIRDVTKYARAVLAAWFPGTEGGNAVCDILFGRKNPSGRLSMSFPYSTGQVPLSYHHLATGRPYNGDERNRFQSRYLDAPTEPLYPFGYGLSYTDFVYSKVNLTKTSLSKDKADDSITASLEVRNTGPLEGTETVQLYIQDICGSVARPVRELKGFRQITLVPGESRRVEFTVTEEMLRFTTADNCFESEPGKFRIFIGADSTTTNAVEFLLK